MSLIIKGVDMPKSGESITYSSKEIIEIPRPHGRLIDADQLQTAIHGLLCENCVTFSCEKGIGCLIEDVFNLIDEAPAVIEAEHESEARKWARVGRDISKGLQEGIEAINSEVPE